MWKACELGAAASMAPCPLHAIAYAKPSGFWPDLDRRRFRYIHKRFGGKDEENSSEIFYAFVASGDRGRCAVVIWAGGGE